MQPVSSMFDKGFHTAKDAGYNYMVIAVDLHGTMINTKVFNETQGKFLDKIEASLFPQAITALQAMSAHKSIVMYVYSGTKKSKLKKLVNYLYEKYGISLDTRYHPMTQHASQSFKTKPYFNILLDDRAGFDPTGDWLEIIRFMPRLNTL